MNQTFNKIYPSSGGVDYKEYFLVNSKNQLSFQNTIEIL